MFPARSNRLAASLAVCLLAMSGGCSAQERDDGREAEAQQPKPRLGLFTTLPIYWGEGGMDAILAADTEPDWVRTELETRFELVPLDTLEAEALEGLDRVFLAQPRPLAPSENVALDEWLVHGGMAAIFADPMLTRHSDFALGDPRRPQDVVLLSPILRHWGVELEFDEDQPSGERMVEQSGYNFPVNLAGRFRKLPNRTSDPGCTVLGEGLLAQCHSGRGFMYLYADAALLDWEEGGQVPESRKQALWATLQPLVVKDHSAPAQ